VGSCGGAHGPPGAGSTGPPPEWPPASRGAHVQALTNDQWGFESNCFVCEARNDAGLRIPFFHDEDTGTVTATFTLDDRFSGAPSYVHGGLLLAVLDEAMAWAAIAVAHRWAMT